MDPFRISFKGVANVSLETLRDNIVSNRNVPNVPNVPKRNGRLAIVGGGASILNHIQDLQNWDGDIWGINKTPEWLFSHGIQSKLFSVDAVDVLDSFASPDTVGGGVFASWCSPRVISRYKNSVIAHMEPIVPGGIHGGSTSAASAPLIALAMGYHDVTYFGCEGSFCGDTHAYKSEDATTQLIVRANGEDFRTLPPYLIQCQEMVKLLTAFPDFLHEKSGGLLRAMMHDKTWEIVAVSESLKTHLEVINGKSGLYENRLELS